MLDRGEHGAKLGQVGAIPCSPNHSHDNSDFAPQMITTSGLESAARR